MLIKRTKKKRKEQSSDICRKLNTRRVKEVLNNRHVRGCFKMKLRFGLQLFIDSNEHKNVHQVSGTVYTC